MFSFAVACLLRQTLIEPVTAHAVRAAAKSTDNLHPFIWVCNSGTVHHEMSTDATFTAIQTWIKSRPSWEVVCGVSASSVGLRCYILSPGGSSSLCCHCGCGVGGVLVCYSQLLSVFGCIFSDIHILYECRDEIHKFEVRNPFVCLVSNEIQESLRHMSPIVIHCR